MAEVFSGSTANDVWKYARSLIFREPIERTESRVGEVFDLGPGAFVIADPRQRWVTARSPVINPAFALAEVIWILQGRNDASFLNYFNSKLPDYAGNHDAYHGAYGYRLRNHFGIDQIDQAFNTLRGNPNSRQVVLQIWDSGLDLPLIDGVPRNPDIPCNVIGLLKIRNGKLNWTQIMRSNDLYRGTPYNFIQFTTLQEVIAGWLSVDVGTYTQFSDSIHAYVSDLNSLNTISDESMSANLDVLAVNRAQSEVYFSKLEDVCNLIIVPEVSADSIYERLHQLELPNAYRNIACVLCAEGIRRRGNLELAYNSMKICSNLLFRQLFDLWSVRVRKKMTRASGE